MKVKKIELGQTLIETLAALAVMSIVLSAIAVAVTTSLSNAEYNRDQTLATKYAQQGTEIVRQVRDADYTAFSQKNGIYCLGKGQTSLGSPLSGCTPNIDNFVRSVQIQQIPGCSANVAKVTISVAFSNGKCTNPTNPYCHAQIETSCLSTLNPVQVP
ncbi:MAG TPA: prepilin-type N-terminal cleavage/methylation domain-containing protein [Candidatus Sulfotelmatobacter sp.]|jgi:type II secretory pathway pseudopilin PulG|nr:prepilin-type N-terminal cleavage/methylation domain-containing protein [Candidatus Sulfotelmatobacter sp.]